MSTRAEDNILYGPSCLGLMQDWYVHIYPYALKDRTKRLELLVLRSELYKLGYTSKPGKIESETG